MVLDVWVRQDGKGAQEQESSGWECWMHRRAVGSVRDPELGHCWALQGGEHCRLDVVFLLQPHGAAGRYFPLNLSGMRWRNWVFGQW